MQLISKFNKAISFLLCIFDIFSKYAWIVFLKDQNCIMITNAFQNILDDSGREPNRKWVDKGIEVYKSPMKDGCKITIKKCIKHTTKENLLLKLKEKNLQIHDFSIEECLY